MKRLVGRNRRFVGRLGFERAACLQNFSDI